MKSPLLCLASLLPSGKFHQLEQTGYLSCYRSSCQCQNVFGYYFLSWNDILKNNRKIQCQNIKVVTEKNLLYAEKNFNLSPFRFLLLSIIINNHNGSNLSCVSTDPGLHLYSKTCVQFSSPPQLQRSAPASSYREGNRKPQ